MFWPLATVGPGRLVLQAGGTRFVVYCRVKKAALVGQVNVAFPPMRPMVSCGGVTGIERLNTVPLPERPPETAVPYSRLSDTTSPA